MSFTFTHSIPDAPALLRPIVVVMVGSKGGTLKTAGTCALGHVFAERGYHSVLVDLDPQGSLTLRSGHARESDPFSAAPRRISYAVPGGADTSKTPAGTVHLYGGGRVMDGANTDEIELHLQRILSGEETGRPDVVIIDTPPALGPLTITAMRHASIVIVPSEATREGVDGVQDVVELHESLRLGMPLRVLLTRVHGSSVDLTEWACRELSGLVADDAAAQAGAHELLLNTRIPFSLAGKKSSVFGLPVTATARRDASSTGWRRAATEIVRNVLGLQMRERRVPVRDTQSSGAGDPTATDAIYAVLEAVA
jgi:chromosome partitioning protein